MSSYAVFEPGLTGISEESLVGALLVRIQHLETLKLFVRTDYSHELNTLKAEALSLMGEEDESRALHSEFLDTPAQFGPFAKAQIYALRGENDDAFKSLEVAFEQHHQSLANILAREAFHHLEADPRYPIFLEKMGLLEAWQAIPNE